MRQATFKFVSCRYLTILFQTVFSAMLFILNTLVQLQLSLSLSAVGLKIKYTIWHFYQTFTFDLYKTSTNIKWTDCSVAYSKGPWFQLLRLHHSRLKILSLSKIFPTYLERYQRRDEYIRILRVNFVEKIKYFCPGSALLK